MKNSTAALSLVLKPNVLGRSRFQSPSAFTLLELFISICILCLLVAISMPIATRARGQSQAISCIQNIKNVGAAMNIYIAEKGPERKRPQSIYSFLGGSVPGEDTWSNQLIKGGYLTDRAVMRCPAVKPTVALTANNWFYEVYGLNLVTQPNLSIGENASIGGFTGGVYNLPIVRIQEPSRLILFADSRKAALSAAGLEVQSYRLLQGTGGAKTDGMILRHQGRANIYFLDGHVESLDKEGLMRIQEKPYAFVPYYDEAGTYRAK